MQFHHTILNNPQSSDINIWRRCTKSFLKPIKPTTSFIQVAGAKRGPPRYLGWTKSQVLDTLMRTNARICFSFALLFFPVCIAWGYRYQTVLKPKKVMRERKREEELLAEGKYQKH